MKKDKTDDRKLMTSFNSSKFSYLINKVLQKQSQSLIYLWHWMPRVPLQLTLFKQKSDQWELNRYLTSNRCSTTAEINFTDSTKICPDRSVYLQDYRCHTDQYQQQKVEWGNTTKRVARNWFCLVIQCTNLQAFSIQLITLQDIYHRLVLFMLIGYFQFHINQSMSIYTASSIFYRSPFYLFVCF